MSHFFVKSVFKGRGVSLPTRPRCVAQLENKRPAGSKASLTKGLIHERIRNAGTETAKWKFVSFKTLRYPHLNCPFHSRRFVPFLVKLPSPMKPWISFAILSMIFAGLTSVIAKKGLVGISGEAGLTIRTLFVVVFVLAFAALHVPMKSLKDLTHENYLWLGLSGLTTAGSWIFYYKALKDGEVSTIALIDKGSILISILLACFILKEQITARMVLGGTMMLGGLAIIATR